MKINAKITFIISFIIAYFIVGYVINTMFVAIDWVEDVTIWDKLKWYYIGSGVENIIPSIIIALIPTFIVAILNHSKNHHISNKL